MVKVAESSWEHRPTNTCKSREAPLACKLATAYNSSRDRIVERSTCRAISGLASCCTRSRVQALARHQIATISATSSTRIRAWRSYSSIVDLVAIWIRCPMEILTLTVSPQGVHHSAFCNRVRSAESPLSPTVRTTNSPRELVVALAGWARNSKWEGLWVRPRSFLQIWPRMQTIARFTCRRRIQSRFLSHLRIIFKVSVQK